MGDGLSAQSWVLLEARHYARRDPAGATPEAAAGHTTTDRGAAPELTAAERTALETVFRQALSWPPSHSIEPIPLKQTGTALGFAYQTGVTPTRATCSRW